MKPQDLIFLFVVIVLFMWKKHAPWYMAALVSLALAIPLFFLHIFFTAERLTWYAAAFFATGVGISYFRPHTVQ